MTAQLTFRFVAAVFLSIILSFNGAIAETSAVPLLQRDEVQTGQFSGSEPEVYRIVGIPGERLRADVTAAGKLSLVLYTPDGKQIALSKGVKSVQLDVVLSTPGSVYLAVARSDGDGAYKLSLTGTDPSFAESMFSTGVGYTSGEGEWEMVKCWITPGSVYRETYKNGFVRTFTLGRDNAVHLTTNGGVDRSLRYFQQEFALVGDALEITTLEAGQPQDAAKVTTYKLGVPKEGYQSSLNWSGYLCR